VRLEYFDMIDQVVTVNVGDRSILAQSRVPKESPIFEGHFPGHPLMPGVLLIETMAQASGYLILALNAFTQMPFLASVKQAKLRSFVDPDRELTVNASLLHDGSGFAVTQAEIRCESEAICDAELTFKTLPLEEPGLMRHLREKAGKMGLPITQLHHA